MDTAKLPRPTKPYHLISTFLSPLALRQCQLRSRLQGRLGNAPKRVTASVACEGEVRHVPYGGSGNFGQYIEGGTTSMDCEVDPNNSGYFTFDPGGMSTINWRPTVGQL